MSSISDRGRAAATAAVTPNQRAILLRLFAGEPEDAIAAASGRKPSTIFNTVRRVRDQLGARNEYDLFRLCVRRGIVSLREINAYADALEARARNATGTLPS